MSQGLSLAGIRAGREARQRDWETPEMVAERARMCERERREYALSMAATLCAGAGDPVKLFKVADQIMQWIDKKKLRDHSCQESGEAVSDWRPIETAPKEPDASGLTPSVLLACYGGREPWVGEGHWRPALPAGPNGRAYEEGWVASIDPDVWPASYLRPLYWQPHPQAPPEPSNDTLRQRR